MDRDCENCSCWTHDRDGPYFRALPGPYMRHFRQESMTSTWSRKFVKWPQEFLWVQQQYVLTLKEVGRDPPSEPQLCNRPYQFCLAHPVGRACALTITKNVCFCSTTFQGRNNRSKPYGRSSKRWRCHSRSFWTTGHGPVQIGSRLKDEKQLPVFVRLGRHLKFSWTLSLAFRDENFVAAVLSVKKCPITQCFFEFRSGGI